MSWNEYILEKGEKWAVFLEHEDGACEDGWWCWDGKWLYASDGLKKSPKNEWFYDIRSTGILWSSAIGRNWTYMAEQLNCEGLLPWGERTE